jgi:hypothetical protein
VSWWLWLAFLAQIAWSLIVRESRAEAAFWSVVLFLGAICYELRRIRKAAESTKEGETP